MGIDISEDLERLDKKPGRLKSGEVFDIKAVFPSNTSIAPDLVEDANAKLPNPKLGHISASCWSVEHDNPFSLAILKDGKNMIGQKLFALSPLKNKSIPVEIVSSHYVDPKGERVRS